MSAKKAIGLLGFAVVLAVVGLILRPASDQVVVRSVEIGTLTIELPRSVQANQEFDIAVSGATPGQPLEILVDAGYGHRQFVVDATSATTNVTIPALEGPGSGVAIVSAHSDRKVARASIEIMPGPATSPIDLYLGPRTVVANSEQFSMMVAVPKDALGNPIADATPVSYLITRPSQTAETSTGQTAGLLSYVNVFSSTVAGRTRLAAEVGDATGPERSFLEVAGTPLPFTLEAVDPLPPADGHALVRLRTARLVDKFGNGLPDGTAVTLDATGATGVRRLQTVTIDAVAEFVLEVPDRPGSVELIATASGSTSEPKTLMFASAVSDFPVETADHQRGTLVSIGRVLSARQSYVPDGTVAKVSAGTERFEIPLELGQAEVVVPQTQGTITVEVLGRSITKEIK